jgi:hypothetical protein
MLNPIPVVLLFVFSYSAVQAPAIKLTFTPESEKFLEATKQYQAIWSAEGKKMIDAMEAVSGLKFLEPEVAVIVFEGASNSGYKEKPMKLRASYPEDVKKATIIHELGHRMIVQLRNRPQDIDEHRILFLYLYDVWMKLYGKDFADRMVKVEQGRKGIYDYETAWNWAMSLSAEQRAARFKEIVRTNSSQR